MRATSVLAVALATLGGAACTPRAVLPDAEREALLREVSGSRRFLRVAVNVAPLWGDRARVLVAAEPLAELDLLRGARDEVVPPPPVERILPPGTPVLLRTVELPTPWLIASRVVMSPRWHPWAILEVAGDRRPHVVVLPQTLATAEEARAELARLLATDDPRPALEALPAEQREAVLRKEALEGMGPRALEMAWGLPDKKKLDRPAGTEEWSWSEGRRRAHLQDDKVVKLERETAPRR